MTSSVKMVFDPGELPPEGFECGSGGFLAILAIFGGGTVPGFLRQSPQYAVALSGGSPTLSASTSTRCAAELGADGGAMVHR